MNLVYKVLSAKEASKFDKLNQYGCRHLSELEDSRHSS